jgi:alpha-tubulin suppressor-like RCC1 family protein
MRPVFCPHFVLFLSVWICEKDKYFPSINKGGMIMSSVRKNQITKRAIAPLMAACLVTIALYSTASQAFPHSGVAQIYAGQSAQGACAILADHRMSCWGNGGGISETESFDGVRIVSVAIGADFSCVLLVNGTVACGGGNEEGQLGIGSFAPTTELKNVHDLSGPVSAIAAGAYHVCALMSADGTVQCWGSNSNGQIGNFNVGANFNVPITVVVHDGMTNPPLSNVESISAGAASTCAILNESAGKYSGACWGENNYGQLGNGHDLENDDSPQTLTYDGVNKLDVVASSMSPGNIHTCVMVLDAAPNSVACWGNNDQGQISTGGGTSNPLPSPVIFSDSTKLTGVSAISSGAYFTCGILTDRTGLCWGNDQFGQLGNYQLDRNNAYSPVAIVDTAGNKLTDLAQIVAGGPFTCALVDGQVYCWGDNAEGQLGGAVPFSSTDFPSLVPVDGPIFFDDFQGN